MTGCCSVLPANVFLLFPEQQGGPESLAFFVSQLPACEQSVKVTRETVQVSFNARCVRI